MEQLFIFASDMDRINKKLFTYVVFVFIMELMNEFKKYLFRFNSLILLDVPSISHKYFVFSSMCDAGIFASIKAPKAFLVFSVATTPLGSQIINFQPHWLKWKIY